MKKLRYEFDTEIQFSDPVVEHTFVLRCQPHRRPGVRVLESDLIIEPEMRYMRQVDGFGNFLAIGRKPEPHTHMGYHSLGLVEVDPKRGLAAGAVAAGTAGQATPGSWTSAHPIYRYPSELTRPDDALRAFAQELADQIDALAHASDWEGHTSALAHASHQTGTAGVTARIDELAEAVESTARADKLAAASEYASHAVFEYMEYIPGSTHVRTPATEAFASRAGVCQDFSHVLICILREWGMAARYVSGLALGEGQTHAWVEVFAEDRWLGLDPTRNQLVDDTYIPLAVGRDWTDCPIEQGSFIGAANQFQTVHMTVTEA